MSSSNSEQRFEEASTLTRAVENLLRKLICFLVGRISLVKLQEMIRYIFVEEIENKLRRERPTKNVTLTQLALLSGLDTRTLTKIRNNPKYRQPFHQETSFLMEFTPGASILDYWSSKAPFVDEESGKPKSLAISGNKLSFEALFSDSLKTRGVTYNSLLQRLIESGAVSYDDETNRVSLLAKSYLPSKSTDKPGAIEMGFSALGNMIDTVTSNISALETGEERLYQRGAWTFRLDRGNRSKLRSALQPLLERTDKQARKIIEKHETEFPTSDHITAGISLFYFEEPTSK